MTKKMIASLALLSRLALAEGGWSGNGGGTHADQDNTWFLGDEPVEYCVKVGPRFPVSQAEASALVKQAIGDWIDFLASYGLTEPKLGTGATLSGIFPDKKTRGLSTRFEQVQNCDATQKQIEFLFGVSNEIIDQYRIFSSNEIGLALRPHYDSTTYRNGGFIWIPGAEAGIDWAAKPNRLKHILLHEIGHVFGMKHDSTFVMDREVGSSLLSNRWEKPYGKIEAPAWPYKLTPGREIDFSYHHYFPPEEARKDFGLSEQGHIRIRLSLNALSELLLTIGTRELRGIFDKSTYIPVPLGNGPGVWTQWLSTGMPYFYRLTFDWSWDFLPREGAFTYASQTYAASITNTRGVQIKLFLPVSAKWWIIKDPTLNDN